MAEVLTRADGALDAERVTARRKAVARAGRCTRAETGEVIDCSVVSRRMCSRAVSLILSRVCSGWLRSGTSHYGNKCSRFCCVSCCCSSSLTSSHRMYCLRSRALSSPAGICLHHVDTVIPSVMRDGTGVTVPRPPARAVPVMARESPLARWSLVRSCEGAPRIRSLQPLRCSFLRVVHEYIPSVPPCWRGSALGGTCVGDFVGRRSHVPWRRAVMSTRIVVLCGS